MCTPLPHDLGVEVDVLVYLQLVHLAADPVSDIFHTHLPKFIVSIISSNLQKLYAMHLH